MKNRLKKWISFKIRYRYHLIRIKLFTAAWSYKIWFGEYPKNYKE